MNFHEKSKPNFNKKSDDLYEKLMELTVEKTYNDEFMPDINSKKINSSEIVYKEQIFRTEMAKKLVVSLKLMEN